MKLPSRLRVAVTLACFAVVGGCRPSPAHAPAKAPRAEESLAPASGTSVPEATSAPHGAATSPAQLLRVSRKSAATQAERDHFLYLPAGHGVDENKRWPVLLFLHGNGERGDAKGELDYLLENGPLYEAWIQKRDLPFIIIAPQLPMYEQDERADYLKNRKREEIPARLEEGTPKRPAEFATPEPMLGAIAVALPNGATPYGPPMGWPELEADLLAMLDEVVETRQGDAARQYLTGLSYGGFGTWYLASKHPERFAAIVPVVGYGHPELMAPIAKAKVPIWCFAGGRDGNVKAQYFYAGLNRLEALGHDGFRFTIEADMGHDVWARVYGGNDVFDWMLSHQRAPR